MDIRAVYLASWRAGYEGLLSEDVIERLALDRAQYDWGHSIRRDDGYVAVAEDREDVVGVVGAVPPPGGARDLPEVEMLYVEPGSWGTSAATDLLAAAVGWMVDASYPAARLRVVDRQAWARRFYEREGWTVDPDLSPASNGLFELIYYRRSLGE